VETTIFRDILMMSRVDKCRRSFAGLAGRAGDSRELLAGEQEGSGFRPETRAYLVGGERIRLEEFFSSKAGDLI